MRFGRLKSRWRSLLKGNDMKLDNLCIAVSACCVLHNICEVHHDIFDEHRLEEVEETPVPSRTGSFYQLALQLLPYVKLFLII